MVIIKSSEFPILG